MPGTGSGSGGALQGLLVAIRADSLDSCCRPWPACQGTGGPRTPHQFRTKLKLFVTNWDVMRIFCIESFLFHEPRGNRRRPLVTLSPSRCPQRVQLTLSLHTGQSQNEVRVLFFSGTSPPIADSCALSLSIHPFANTRGRRVASSPLGPEIDWELHFEKVNTNLDANNWKFN